MYQSHFKKNFRKDPESLAKSGLEIDGLASITRSKNTLGQLAMTRLSQRYRQLIFEGKVSPKSSDSEIAKAVGKLRTNLYAALYHSTILDDPKIPHQYCPDGPHSRERWSGVGAQGGRQL